MDSGFPGNQGQRWQEAAKARRSNELGHVLKLPEQEQVRWFGQRTFEFGEFLQQSLSSAEFRAQLGDSRYREHWNSIERLKAVAKEPKDLGEIRQAFLKMQEVWQEVWRLVLPDPADSAATPSPRPEVRWTWEDGKDPWAKPN